MQVVYSSEPSSPNPSYREAQLQRKWQHVSLEVKKLYSESKFKRCAALCEESLGQDMIVGADESQESTIY